MDNNGPLHWLLGMEICRDCQQQTITFSQQAYIEDIIEKYGFADTKPLAMPADPHVQLSVNQLPKTPQESNIMKYKPYAESVGTLNYASITT